MHFSWMFFGGTIPVFVSFFAVGILGHYGDWDPVLDALKWICKKAIGLCRKKRYDISIKPKPKVLSLNDFKFSLVKFPLPGNEAEIQ